MVFTFFYKLPHANYFIFSFTVLTLKTISGGAGTRILGYPSPTFFGLPEPDFSRSGMYPTLLEPYLMKKPIKFGVKGA